MFSENSIFKKLLVLENVITLVIMYETCPLLESLGKWMVEPNIIIFAEFDRNTKSETNRK